MKRRGHPWTRQEDERLLALAQQRPRPTDAAIAAELGRNLQGISHRLCHLRRRGGMGRFAAARWSHADDERLVALVSQRPRPTNAAIATELGRSLSAVSNRLMCLRQQGTVAPPRHRWTREEDARLVALVSQRPRPTNTAIATELGRSLSSVTNQLKRLRQYEVARPGRQWTREEDARLVALVSQRPRPTNAAIAAELGRSHRAVEGRRRYLSLGVRRSVGRPPQASSSAPPTGPSGGGTAEAPDRSTTEGQLATLAGERVMGGRRAVFHRGQMRCPDCGGVVGQHGPSIPCPVERCQWFAGHVESEVTGDGIDALAQAILSEHVHG